MSYNSGRKFDEVSCYICNKGCSNAVQPYSAVVVDDDMSAARIIAMFSKHRLYAKLDYNASDSMGAHIIVGACEKHIPNLEKLVKLCSQDNRINSARILESMKV